MLFFAALVFFIQIQGSSREQQYFDPYSSVFSDTFVSVRSPISERLSQNDYERLELLKILDQDHVLKEFKRVLRIDYDTFYKENYASKKLFAREVWLKNAEKNIAKAEDATRKLCTHSEWRDYKRFHGRVLDFLQTEQGSVIAKNNIVESVADDVKRIRALLGVESCIILRMNTKTGIASSNWQSDEEIGDGVFPTLGFNDNFFRFPCYLSRQFIIGHEIAHLKRVHSLRPSLPDSAQAKETLRALRFYREEQADIDSATLGLGFARQFEYFTLCKLKEALSRFQVLDLLDNTPNEPLARRYEVHPTAVIRHTYATQLLGLMEAEARWWRSMEAYERYGDVAYEKGYQRWVQQQARFEKMHAFKKRLMRTF